jgi:hypothetical protein
MTWVVTSLFLIVKYLKYLNFKKILIHLRCMCVSGVGIMFVVMVYGSQLPGEDDSAKI